MGGEDGGLVTVGGEDAVVGFEADPYPLLLDAYQAGGAGCHHRRVVRHNTQSTLVGAHLKLGDFTADDLTARGEDAEGEGGHVRVLAFSKTSSMVPTM